MRVAVFGLGYVGTVTAACLARLGHDLIGVDVNPTKIELLNAGRSPIVEPELDGLLTEAVAAGRLRATAEARVAVQASELSLVCVGTPGRDNGSLDLRAVDAVARQVGDALAGGSEPHTIVLRSTLLPGTTQGRIAPLIARHARRGPGDGVTVCVNPEFLREGSAVRDFLSPSFTLIGADNAAGAAAVRALYQDIAAPVLETTPSVAETVKYVSNAFHALKIGFANEVGAFCKHFGIDSHAVMDIFCRDRRLNLSAAYLRPGYAFGGSCLPKDLRALLYRARQADVELPILGAVLESNEMQVRRVVDMVRRTGRRRVGVVGLSFKPGTDDLRESPLVLLVESLLGKGYEIRILDEDLSLAHVLGANRTYIERVLPHVSSLLCSRAEVLLQHAEVLVVGKRSAEVESALASRNGRRPLVIDLVRCDALRTERGYSGVAW